jgi:hypothetical protein
MDHAETVKPLPFGSVLDAAPIATNSPTLSTRLGVVLFVLGLGVGRSIVGIEQLFRGRWA